MVLKSKVRISSILFRFVVILLTAAVAFLAIGLIGYLLKKGLPYVNRAFLFTEPDILMDSYGIKPMIINTIYTVVLTLIFCIPLGIGSAIYLAEYAKQGKIVSGIRFAIEILAGIPSIVYGLFGLNFFVRKMAIGDYAGSMLAASLNCSANDDSNDRGVFISGQSNVPRGSDCNRHVKVLYDSQDYSSMCNIGNCCGNYIEYWTYGK